MSRRAHFKRLRRDRPYYLIPIMMGMAGVLFSSQLDHAPLRMITVVLCVGVPLMLGGNLIGRVYSGGLQRLLLLAGMFTLTIGAVVTVSGLTESLVSNEYVTPQIGEISRWIGMASLLLGLLVVLYTMVRSEAMFDELGDRFRHVADHIGEGFLLLNADDEVILMNRALAEMVGMKDAEVYGRRIGTLVKQFNVKLAEPRPETRDTALASSYQATWVRNGEERRMLVSESPLFDRRKHRVGTLFTLHDITEEHRLKVALQQYTEGLQHIVEQRTEKLRASEARYRGLLLTMNEGFVTVAGDLTIRFSNDRLREILQTDEEHLTGRKLTDFVHPTDRERFEHALVDAIPDVASAGQEFIFVRDSGQSVQVKASVAALEESSDFGRARYSLVITDVQELKRMQLELEQRARELELANQELRDLDRAKDVFLSNVSHELRTPLGTIDGYVDMFQAESLGPISPPGHAALEVMSRNVQRLTRMINEMIESSRIQIRGVKLVRELHSLHRLLDEARASIYPSALSKDISVNLDAPESLPFVWGDHEKLAQVLAILLSNAIKFTNSGGIITLQARVEGDAVVMRVSDTGIGIPAEHQERVFRKFYQVDSSMTRHYAGTGIGLSIAKSIVEAHGGRIKLESVPGEGSAFTIVLTNAAYCPGDVVASLGGKRILLVNEFEESLQALSETFRSAGAVVTPLVSSFECIRRAREQVPNLIVLDESLRDLPIIDTIQRLRSDRATSKVPILTLWDRPSGGPGAEESAVAGLARILAKPFTPEALAACAVETELPEAEPAAAPMAGNVGT